MMGGRWDEDDDGDVEEEEDDEVEEDDVEEEDVEEEDRSLGWQTHFVRAALWKFTGKMGEDSSGTEFCASLCNGNAHRHFTKAILCWNLLGKWPGTLPGTSFYASLRNRDEHGHFTRAICLGKWPRAPPGTSFCASLRSWNAHGHFTSAIFRRIHKESAARALALTLTVRTPTMWPHCLGNICTCPLAAEVLEHEVLCPRINPKGSKCFVLGLQSSGYATCWITTWCCYSHLVSYLQ